MCISYDGITLAQSKKKNNCNDKKHEYIPLSTHRICTLIIYSEKYIAVTGHLIQFYS